MMMATTMTMMTMMTMMTARMTMMMMRIQWTPPVSATPEEEMY